MVVPTDPYFFWSQFRNKNCPINLSCANFLIKSCSSVSLTSNLIYSGNPHLHVLNKVGWDYLGNNPWKYMCHIALISTWPGRGGWSACDTCIPSGVTHSNLGLEEDGCWKKPGQEHLKPDWMKKREAQCKKTNSNKKCLFSSLRNKLTA